MTGGGETLLLGQNDREEERDCQASNKLLVLMPHSIEILVIPRNRNSCIGKLCHGPSHAKIRLVVTDLIGRFLLSSENNFSVSMFH